MLGGPGKERIGLRKVEWGEGRIRTQRCDLAAADWYSSTSHVPSTDKQVSEKQLPTFSVPRPPASLGRTEESVCVCVHVFLLCPKTHPAGLEGYCI